ncbi:hypothetical protein WICANDRAFT_59900 [Wickerhamomyces anomalus NRRL Y-366-8]|uniref:UNC-45/Cro1/She4 central domain-containing protein n=1 Tax=Wickerhamomyces anomalus (strain ATCC 58044 / CBS 1984 / NCYC 433 / NRRL Y-366-8) TaxID=683960 RepID=A0A1E3P9C8_WICAA|nr:uncharacterized protein WICANDRAFT_59900 [Wickerhamomyces anomalus NRRL Y-366-8]ODQ61824.1 hypothetical protein WICANDRAFT_59900 [Wickerhamomyces anomalus NRRL Y-366-8]
MAEMDLEHVLFGLSTFVNDCEEKKLNVDNVYKESYLKLLDQMALLLREESTRDHDLIRSNLPKFIDSADYLLVNQEQPGYNELLLEVIRVLANSIADNDVNRRQLSSKSDFIEHLSNQLESKPDDSSLNERILILLKNLVIDTPDVAKDVSFITQSLLSYISQSDGGIFMAVDLLTDLIGNMQYNPNPQNIENLIKLLVKTLNQQSDLDEDEFAELVVNISSVLEGITVDPRFKFDKAETEKTLQVGLFDSLKKIDSLEFQNILMAKRRLFASIGNISANLTTSNKPMRTYSISNVQDQNQQNGYIISGCFTIIGNSIASPEDRNEVLDQAPALVNDILSKYNYLTDPVQFQGILHLLKALTNFDTVGTLFTDKNFKVLEFLIEATVRNSKYYTNFNVLLTGFLKKLFVLVNQRHVEKILNSGVPEILTSSDPSNESNLIILLLLNKVAIYKSDSNIDIFCNRIFKFSNDIQAAYLFELTKTIGVLLQHRSSYVLENYSSSLITLLTTIDSIDASSNDNAAKAVLNNGRYISGTLLNLSKENDIDPELKALSEKLLRK